MTTEERFWSKVGIRGDDECWEWLACKDRDGYGQFKIEGRQWKAHRVAWTLTFGEIPSGLLCCHHCDNPSCCNPVHLFLGTDADNAADKMSKGRSTQGERNVNSRLSEGDVLEIRQLWTETGLTQREIGAMFGIAQCTTCDIVNHKSWRWLVREAQ